MKKLAIIGSSNAFIKGGYGQKLKAIYGEQCDIYALGITGMGWVTYTLLMHKIANEYEYVIIQFGPRDTSQIELGIQSPYSTIAYLLFILDNLCKSSTVPIFICASYTKAGLFEKYQYLIKAMCRIYGVKLIDLQTAFSYIESDKVLFDNAHYSPLYVDFIVEQVQSSLTRSEYVITDSDIDINFNIFYPQHENGYRSMEYNTSLISGITYVLENEKEVFLPENKYLCGMLFWLKEKGTNLYYSNSYISFVKYLYLGGYTELYGFLDIGANIFPGLKGGTLSSKPKSIDLYYEDGILLSIGSGKPIYMHSFLLSDRPPLMAGYEFYNRHNHIFIDEREKADIILLKRAGKVILPFQNRLDELVPGSWDFFHQILQDRPDLGTYINDSDWRAERLLFWAWTAGQFEIDILKDYSSELESGIKKLLATPYKAGEKDGYSILLHVIWEQREDLQTFDPETREGREYLAAWFAAHGAKEYNLPLK